MSLHRGQAQGQTLKGDTVQITYLLILIENENNVGELNRLKTSLVIQCKLTSVSQLKQVGDVIPYCIKERVFTWYEVSV